MVIFLLPQDFSFKVRMVAYHYPSRLIFCVFFLVSSVSPAVLVGGFHSPSFPLLFESQDSLRVMFEPRSVIIQHCQANPESLNKHILDLDDCLSKSSEGFESMILTNMSVCLQNSATSLARLCQLNEEDTQFVAAAVENNRNILVPLYANGTDAIREFFSQTSDCVTDKINEFRCCAVSHTKSDMRYNEEGCRSMKAYIDCSDGVFRSCSEDLANKQTQLVTAAMKESCKDFLDIIMPPSRESDLMKHQEETRHQEEKKLQEETNSILLRILGEMKQQTELLKQLQTPSHD